MQASGPAIKLRRSVRYGSVGVAASRLALCVLAGSLATPAFAQNAPAPAPAAPATAPTDPIIGDEEFDAAIPPIDDIDAPLGSVSDWQAEQQRLDAQQRGVSRPDGTATFPAAQDGDPVEALPDPPINDPQIDDPLPPLDAFDVQPFDESQYTEADDQGAREVRYRYRIEGLDEARADGGIEPVDPDDIRSRFAELSVLEDGDGEAANGAMVRARMAEDQQLLLDLLSSEGYFDATVSGDVKLPEEGSRGAIEAILSVVPGPRYALGSIRFDSPPLVPPGLIADAFVPKSGEPIVAERILAAEANIAVSLPEEGYPFVEIGERDILLDPQTQTGDYTLPVTPGPRSVYGDIVIAGAKPVFEPDHIADIARFERGELYDSRMVDDLRQALVATGLFSAVAVDPQPSGTAAGDGTEFATLRVTQEKGPQRTLAGQAGYGTGEGFKLEGSWTHRNLFPPEGALIASATAGTQEQGAGVTFRRSNAGSRDRTVELSLDARHSDFDAFEAYTGRLAGRISRLSTPIWQKKWSWSYGFELLASSEEDYDFALGRRMDALYYVAALPAMLTFDSSDSLLDPTSGFRLSANVSPEASLGTGTQTYGRVRLDATGYMPVGDGFVVAGRTRVGAILGAGRDRIAPSRRFYAGGGGSVRGFGYQELGPKDPDDRPIGGRSLVEAAVEARYRFGNYGIVGFVDAGQVYTSDLPRFNDWRFGVGVGGRFYTNFGPMRLDVATPINRKPGESRVSIYISIGQAF